MLEEPQSLLSNKFSREIRRASVRSRNDHLWGRTGGISVYTVLEQLNVVRNIQCTNLLCGGGITPRLAYYEVARDDLWISFVRDINGLISQP